MSEHIFCLFPSQIRLKEVYKNVLCTKILGISHLTDMEENKKIRKRILRKYCEERRWFQLAYDDVQ
jgi:hypothetical protein